MTPPTAHPICPGCGRAAAGPDRYCAGCGEPLETPGGVGCLACGTQNPERARFCMGCGTPLGSVGGAERRVISVLFADVSGFTGLTERLDAEEVHAFMSGCLDLLCDCVTRWGGFVDKFIGDCVMALFGAPVAYENEAERAVRAALDMQAAMQGLGVPAAARDAGFRPRLRIGIHTGPVVTGVFSGGGTVDYTAIGDTVNVASRLQGLCEPGGVLVGSTTYEGTRHLCEFGPERVLDVKGRREPVRARQVVALREVRGSLRGIEGHRPALIGRGAELARLAGEWERVRTAGEAGVCLVIGPAGIGKSRLIEEFLERSEIEDGRVRRGRSYPYASNTPWEPIAELLLDVHGLAPRTDADEAADRIVRAVGGRGPNADPVLREALATALGRSAPRGALAAYRPAERQERIHAAVLEALRAGPEGPRVCVLEDLHWADHATLDFLAELAAERIRDPLLLLLVTRPPLPSEPGLERLIEAVENRVVLSPLSAEESRRLVETLLGAHELPAELVDSLLERAGGNPLFIEESLKSMMASGQLSRDSGIWRASEGAERMAMPDTIESVLTTRIDGLEPSTRRVLQYASVVGRRFWSGVLSDALARRPVDRELGDLSRGAFVRPLPVSVLESDREFAFEHLLLQEAAYESLLRGMRTELHGVVGEWLERQLGDRASEFAEWIAYHYERSDAPARAVPHLERAAGDAHERGAVDDALSLIDRALRRAETDTDRFRLWCRAEDVANAAAQGDRRRAALVELERLAQTLGDPARLEAGYRRARWLLDTGDLASARSVAQETLADCRSDAEISRQDDLLSLSGRIAHLWGDYPEALRLYRSALPLHRRSGDRGGAAETLDRLGLVQIDIGDYCGGLELLDEALALSKELGRRPLESRIVAHRSEALRCLGRHAEAEEEALRALELAEAAGSRRARATAELTLAVAIAAAGRTEQATARLSELCEAARAIDRPRLEARALLALAETAEGAVARRHAAAARERARATGLVHVEVLALVREAELALEAGELEAADEAAAPALRMLREHGSIQGPEERVVFTRARVLAALGREREAAALLEEAEKIVRETAARIPDPGERERFLNDLPLNRAILDASRAAGGAERR